MERTARLRGRTRGRHPAAREVGLVLAALLALAGCAGEPGGPTAAADHGASGAHDEGGIGGTGIVGSVTGFGSLMVNGLEIEVDPASVAAVSIGDVVAVVARETETGLSARAVEEIHALVGPVTRVAGGLEVMGVPVSLAAAAEDVVGAVAPGERLRVSGLWRGDTVIASRLERASPTDADAAAGVLRLDQALPRLGGLVLAVGGPEAPAATPLAGGEHGAFARLVGAWSGEALVVRGLDASPPAALAAGVSRLSIEGYVVLDGDGPRVDGLPAPLDPGRDLRAVIGTRAVLVGETDAAVAPAERFSPRHGVPLPEAHDARRALLETLGDGFFPKVNAVSLE